MLRIASYILICNTRHYQRSVLVHILAEGDFGLYDDRRGKLTMGPASEPHACTSPTCLGWSPTSRQLPHGSNKQVSRTQSQAWNLELKAIQPSALNSSPSVLERLSKVNYRLRTNYLGRAASGAAHLQSPLSGFCSVLM